MQINWGVTVLLQRLLNISDKRSVEKLTTPNLCLGSVEERSDHQSGGVQLNQISGYYIIGVNGHSRSSTVASTMCEQHSSVTIDSYL